MEQFTAQEDRLFQSLGPTKENPQFCQCLPSVVRNLKEVAFSG